MGWKRGLLLAGLALAALCGTRLEAQRKPFNPKQDLGDDYAAAKEKAAAEQKNILLDFGANWCGPCLMLDETLHEDPDLYARLEKYYVVLHVDVGGLFGSSKQVKELRRQYPPFRGYPHLMVVSADGTLVHDRSPSGVPMTRDKLVDRKELGEFLDTWAPHS